MKHVYHVPESCLQHCTEGVSEVDIDSIDSFSLSVGFMRDKILFLHVDVCWHFNPACPHFDPVLTHCLFHDPLQPLVDDVIEQLVPAVEQHYRSLIRRFCCLLCGGERWCHSWWTDSDALCQWVSRVESTFHSPTLARSKIPHPSPTLSSRAHWGTCPGLANCLGLTSIQRTLQFLD